MDRRQTCKLRFDRIRSSHLQTVSGTLCRVQRITGDIRIDTGVCVRIYIMKKTAMDISKAKCSSLFLFSLEMYLLNASLNDSDHSVKDDPSAGSAGKHQTVAGNRKSDLLSLNTPLSLLQHRRMQHVGKNGRLKSCGIRVDQKEDRMLRKKLTAALQQLKYR